MRNRPYLRNRNQPGRHTSLFRRKSWKAPGDRASPAAGDFAGIANAPHTQLPGCRVARLARSGVLTCRTERRDSVRHRQQRPPFPTAWHISQQLTCSGQPRRCPVRPRLPHGMASPWRSPLSANGWRLHHRSINPQRALCFRIVSNLLAIICNWHKLRPSAPSHQPVGSRACFHRCWGGAERCRE